MAARGDNGGRSRVQIDLQRGVVNVDTVYARSKPGRSQTSGYRHRPWHILLIYVTLLITGFVFFMNTIASVGDPIGIFHENVRNVSSKYDTHMTPAGWTFPIWCVIFIWQILWLLWAASQTGRMGVDNYLYLSPTLLPCYLYILYLISQALQLVWLVLFTREKLIASLLMIFLTTVFLYVCLYISLSRLTKERDGLVKSGFRHEPALCVVFAHNGLGLYAAWVSITTLLHLIMVMHYVAGATMKDATTVALVLLLMEYLMWVFVDDLFLDSYTRWTLTPYFVVVWAASGAVVKNYDSVDGRNRGLLLAVLVVACVGLIYKLVASTYRANRRSTLPRTPHSGQPALSTDPHSPAHDNAARQPQIFYEMTRGGQTFWY